MRGRRLFDGLAAAGLVVGVAAWERSERRRLRGRRSVTTARAAVAAPEQPRVPAPSRPPRRRGRRLATSLAFVTLFFAGAALSAGAGNETVQAADTPTVAAVTDAGTATGTDPAATDAAPADPAPAGTTETTAPGDAAPPPETTTATDAPAAADAAPADAPSADAPPADPAAADPGAADPVVTDAVPPAEASAADAAPAETAPGAVAPAPAVTTGTTATAAPQPAAVARAAAAPAPRHAPPATPVRRVAATLARPLPLPTTAAPVFYPTVPFDLQAWEHDNTSAPLGAAAVAIALHYLGTPYVWGGASPEAGFDCSGLTMYVYAQLGISLPHYAASQFAEFPKLDPSQLEPGDLVFFEPRADGPGHVAIYAGNDTIVEAPHTGALVRIGSLSGSAAAMGFLGAVRPYGTEAAAASALFSLAGPQAATPPTGLPGRGLVGMTSTI